MDKEMFKQEMWSSIDKTAVTLHYLDPFRDNKAKIEPLYRGLLGVTAVVAAIISFFDCSVMIKTASVITAALAAIQFFFPVLPTPSDFHKMNCLRQSVYEWLVQLEGFWYGEWTDKKYYEYMRLKTDYEKLAIFGCRQIERPPVSSSHFFLIII